MSASLVGSEMCIRDRPWASSPPLVACRRSLTSWGRRPPNSPYGLMDPKGCLLYTSDAADDM
eukprot:12907200-Alexandrium_andersonii.AAC.1